MYVQDRCVKLTSFFVDLTVFNVHFIHCKSINIFCLYSCLLCFYIFTKTLATTAANSFL